MKIYTLPVYSRLADPHTIPAELHDCLPPSRRLSQHQLDTYQALTQGEAEVIFNTAMTGDGKSLAGQLPTLVRSPGSPLMALYPTNELVADQEKQFARVQTDWKTDLCVGQLNSAVLDEILAEEDYSQRGDALLSRLRNRDVIFTNPDIFHLVMEQFYLRPKDAPDRITGPLLQKFPQFTFDEFHIFETPQVVSVLNALLFVHEVSSVARPHRFLFQSATPGDLMLEYLHRSGLSVCEIRGQYQHTATPSEPQSWRQILHDAELNFDTLKVEEWLSLHLEDTLLPFFLDHRPGAKGAIIVNSAAAAQRIVQNYAPLLARHGLQMLPNTGLTSRTRRADSYAADLLVGTSTVDVGVDFQINFLLFESRDAGSFLQRLGRLGRHAGFERNGQFIPFSTYAAYALVPPWIQEVLFQGQEGSPPAFTAEDTVDRETLNRAITAAFPPTATFEHYARAWGKFQSARILLGLGSPTVREQYRREGDRLQVRYQDTFGFRLRATVPEYIALQKEAKPLFEEVISFRGGSYFTGCLVDESEAGRDRLKAADLFQVLPTAHLSLLEDDEFYRLVEQAGLARRIFERQQPLAFFRLHGWSDEREDFSVFLDHDLLGWGTDRFGRALVLDGFQIDCRFQSINRRLAQRKLPALLCAGWKPLDLKRRLRLPMLFPIYPFKSRDEITGSVVFGRQALLLHTRLEYSGLNCGGGAVYA